MERIELTREGFSFSRIAQGFWRIFQWNKSQSELEKFVWQIVELGITTFDFADIYGNYECENRFGNVLKNNIHLRSRIEIVTKCGIKLVSPKRPNNKFHSYDTSREHILFSVENSLKAFNTNFIDLLLIHRPNPLMNADETAETFIELKQSGKVRFFGVSNFLPEQFELLQSRLPFPLITNQIEFSPLNTIHQENGNLDFLQKKRIYPMAWSPFAGGKIFNDNSPETIRIFNVIKSIAQKRNIENIPEIILAWILTHPVKFIPILGSGKIENITKAINALNLKLTVDEWFQIWTAAKGKEIP